MNSQRRGRFAFAVLLVLWFFEGAVRKWGPSPLQQPLFFVRDPLVLYIYWLSWRASKSPQSRVLAAYQTLASCYAVAVSVGALMAVVVRQQDPIVALYGWRMYVLPIFLPVCVSRLGDDSWITTFRTCIFALTPFLGLLSLAQVGASANSWLNKSLIEGANILTTSRGVVRATSTFTSPAGHSVAVTLIIAALLMRDPPGTRARSKWLVGCCSFIAVGLVAISGSRLILLNSAIVVCAYLAHSLATSPLRFLRTSLGIASASAIGYGLAHWLAAPVLLAFGQRIAEAQRDTPGSRVLSAATSWLEVYNHAPSIGFGPGSLARGGVSLAGSSWVENELARQLFEVGALFFPFLFVARLGIVSWLVVCALRYSSTWRGPSLVVLAGAAIPAIGWGQVTGQGSINGFAWLVLSLIAILVSTSVSSRPNMSTEMDTQTAGSL
jgi:hypothetical protein